MKFQKLKLENFRQFRDASLDFGADAEGFHLILGSNGAGKTTLLSAFYLALYGKSLESISETLCTEDVFDALADEETTHVAVNLEFTHENQNFFLRRYIKVRRSAGREVLTGDDLTLTNTSTGDQIPVPQRWINTKFPNNLAKFLLFPGEVLEHFFEPGKLDLLSNDIKTLAGLDKLEMLEAACSNVQTRIKQRLAAIPGDETLGRLISQNDGLQSVQKSIEQKISEEYSKLSDMRSELRSKNQYLDDNRSKSLVVTRIDAAKRARDLALEELREHELEQTEFLRTFGYVAFTDTLGSKVKPMIEKMQTDGLFGGVWPERVIAKILADGRCICGCDLQDVSGHVGHFEALAGNKSKLQFPEQYRDLLDALEGGSLDLNAVGNKWAAIVDKLLTTSEQVEVHTQNLTVLQGELKSSGSDPLLAEYVARVVELEANIPIQEEELRALREELNTNNESLEQVQKLMSAATSGQDDRGPLVRQQAALLRVINRIKSEAEALNDLLRAELINELTQKLPPVYDYADFDVSVSRDFAIRITRNGKEIPEAQGQTQLRAICTVAALNRLAKSHTLGNASDINAEDYPLVIDAGLSNLGESFQELALDYLKEGSSQVVLLLLPAHAATPLSHRGAGGFNSLARLHIYTTGHHPSSNEVLEQVTSERRIVFRTYGAPSNETRIEELVL